MRKFLVKVFLVGAGFILRNSDANLRNLKVAYYQSMK